MPINIMKIAKIFWNLYHVCMYIEYLILIKMFDKNESQWYLWNEFIKCQDKYKHSHFFTIFFLLLIKVLSNFYSWLSKVPIL